MDIRVPQLAEGVDNGTVVNVLVKPGDVIRKDQTVIEVETAKAVGSVPSPAAGKVTQILVKEGQEVKTGERVIVMEAAGNGKAAPSGAAAEVAEAPRAPAAPASPPSSPPMRQAPPVPIPQRARSVAGPAAPPSVRKIALQLGIDLNQVPGTERGGRISMADLKNYIAWLEHTAHAPQAKAAPSPQDAPKAPPLPDFSKWGPVEKKKISALRKTISARMAESWRAVPRVTQFADADVTNFLSLKKRVDPAYDKAKTKLTLTAFVLWAVARLLKEFPAFNASLDEAAGEIVFKKYVHLGIAVDTPDGLIVPVLKDTDKKTVPAIARELLELAGKTRSRKIEPTHLEGGTFTISNQGGIGGGAFTPIVYAPQVAILGIGRGEARPAAIHGRVEIRMFLPLGLSYDHRVIDGADAARFISKLQDILLNPREDDLSEGLSIKKSASAKSPTRTKGKSRRAR